jgi:hypothetical protein
LIEPYRRRMPHSAPDRGHRCPRASVACCCIASAT